MTGPGTDAELLRAHVEGDREAFALLVSRHRNRMWAVALRTLGDPEDAADALQEALISAFRNAGSYRGEAAVTTWLHRIVVNACLDRVRRRRPVVPLAEHDHAADRDEHLATETRLDVRAALARLPEAQRLALVLVDMEDLPVAEAASLLGVAEGTVKSRCARGRMALAEMLRGDTRGNRPGGSRVAPTGAAAAAPTGTTAGMAPAGGSDGVGLPSAAGPPGHRLGPTARGGGDRRAQ